MRFAYSVKPGAIGRERGRSKNLCPPCLFACVIAVMLPLAACSLPPSASNAHNALARQIQEESQGRIRLVNFSKTNGLEAETNGVKIYKFEYQAEIEFADECWWAGQPGHFAADPVKASVWDALGHVLQRRMRKGQREKLSGTLEFEKTERGWRGPDGQIY